MNVARCHCFTFTLFRILLPHIENSFLHFSRIMPTAIVWCGQQAIFEGSPSDVAKVIQHVRAVRFPSRDLGTLPHRQIATRISEDYGKVWRGNVFAGGGQDGLFHDDEYCFDFQLSTAYPTYSTELTRKICFHDDCHKVIGGVPQDHDHKHMCVCVICNSAIYCSSECRLNGWSEHKADCKPVTSSGSNNNAHEAHKIKIQHFALKAADKKMTAAIQRAIRLCIRSLFKIQLDKAATSSTCTNVDLDNDVNTVYHVLSNVCPYILSTILSYVGIGAGCIKGKEACTSVTWLTRNHRLYYETNLVALAKQYNCQVTYLWTTCDSTDVGHTRGKKGKLCVSPQGDILHSLKNDSLSDQDSNEDSEFMWVSTNASLCAGYESAVE